MPKVRSHESVRVAMLSVHSSPLAKLGGKEAGGMNVYVRELARELGSRGTPVDIFTRSQERSLPMIEPIACGVRVINLHTGPTAPYDKNWLLTYLPEFVSRVRCFADGEDTISSIATTGFQEKPRCVYAAAGTPRCSICFTP